MNQFIGIEGGGTKFVCAYGSSPEDLHSRVVIPTHSPEVTLKAVADYIRFIQETIKIEAIGASIFGPLDLDKKSDTYGYLTTSAKPGWEDTDFVGYFKKEFNLPIGFDTDVNGAAIAEYRWGAARNISDFIYLTVGTGIGGGIMIDGELVHGTMHPEMGHILIAQDKTRDPFEGVCPFHKNCLEGLASGPAMKARWNVDSALDLPEDHKAWELEAHYLGVGIANYILTLSPKRIIVGGGVMKQKHLLPKLRKCVLKALNGYIHTPALNGDLGKYITPAQLGEQSGVCGAIALAEKSWQDSRE